MDFRQGIDGCQFCAVALARGANTKSTARSAIVFSMFRLFFVRFDNQHHPSVSSSFSLGLPINRVSVFVVGDIHIIYYINLFPEKRTSEKAGRAGAFWKFVVHFFIGWKGGKNRPRLALAFHFFSFGRFLVFI